MGEPSSLGAVELADLNVALNEADLAGVSVDVERAQVVLGLHVLTLPAEGPEPGDRRRRLCLDGVSRVAASYRDGRWDDPSAPVLSIEPEGLPAAIATFVSHSIFGWEFFNCGEGAFAEWADRAEYGRPTGRSG